MAQTTAKKLTFTEFLQQYPDGAGIFELVNGEIVKVEPTRAHKNIARFLMLSFNDEIRRLGLDYIADKDFVVRTMTADGEERGRNPDVSVVKAIASRAYLGNPKVPSVFVYNLVDGCYQSQRYSMGDHIVSKTFPQLALTVEKIIDSSQLRKL